MTESAMKLEKIKSEFYQYVQALQESITAEIKKVDSGVEMIEDIWQRDDAKGAPGGGGRTRAFRGSVIENAGVNTSCVFGAVSEDFAQKIGGDGASMWAAGISLIIHPVNPKASTVHANFRMIQAGGRFWFGGGADLTPYFPHEEDFFHFHDTWKKACAPYETYDDWKKQCDEYFVNHHRGGEMRGIGGIFFDHFFSGDVEKDQAMVKDVSSHFIRSYFPILEKRKDEPFSEEDEDFQLHRRGRYVEFNLVHDRGTHFGLQTNGRTESILISLPGRCKFTYSYRPKEGSCHEKMLEFYRPKKW